LIRLSLSSSNQVAVRQVDIPRDNVEDTIVHQIGREYASAQSPCSFFILRRDPEHVYTDPNGAVDLSDVLLQVNTVQSSANACYVYYQPQGNHLYLATNAGTAWMTPALTPAVAGTASNSQCTLNGGSSSVTMAGDDLTLNVALSFSGTFMGAKNVYLYDAGFSGQKSGWVKKGTWVP
jgi:hypothetical protein